MGYLISYYPITKQLFILNLILNAAKLIEYCVAIFLFLNLFYKEIYFVLSTSDLKINKNKEKKNGNKPSFAFL